MSMHEPCIIYNETSVRNLAGETLSSSYFVGLSCLDCEMTNHRTASTALGHLVHCEELEKLALEHAQRKIN